MFSISLEPWFCTELRRDKWNENWCLLCRSLSASDTGNGDSKQRWQQGRTRTGTGECNGLHCVVGNAYGGEELNGLEMVVWVAAVQSKPEEGGSWKGKRYWGIQIRAFFRNGRRLCRQHGFVVFKNIYQGQNSSEFNWAKPDSQVPKFDWQEFSHQVCLALPPGKYLPSQTHWFGALDTP